MLAALPLQHRHKRLFAFADRVDFSRLPAKTLTAGECIDLHSIGSYAGLLVSVLFSPERESTPIILGGTKQLVKGAFSSPQGAVSAEPAGT